MKRCITCGRAVVKYAEFPCPNCGENTVRCNYCRENKNKFTCKCGYEGP